MCAPPAWEGGIHGGGPPPSGRVITKRRSAEGALGRGACSEEEGHRRPTPLIRLARLGRWSRGAWLVTARCGTLDAVLLLGIALGHQELMPLLAQLRLPTLLLEVRLQV